MQLWKFNLLKSRRSVSLRTQRCRSFLKYLRALRQNDESSSIPNEKARLHAGLS